MIVKFCIPCVIRRKIPRTIFILFFILLYKYDNILYQFNNRIFVRLNITPPMTPNPGERERMQIYVFEIFKHTQILRWKINTSTGNFRSTLWSSPWYFSSQKPPCFYSFYWRINMQINSKRYVYELTQIIRYSHHDKNRHGRPLSSVYLSKNAYVIHPQYS